MVLHAGADKNKLESEQNINKWIQYVHKESIFPTKNEKPQRNTRQKVRM